MKTLLTNNIKVKYTPVLINIYVIIQGWNWLSLNWPQISDINAYLKHLAMGWEHPHPEMPCLGLQLCQPHTFSYTAAGTGKHQHKTCLCRARLRCTINSYNTRASPPSHDLPEPTALSSLSWNLWKSVLQLVPSSVNTTQHFWNGLLVVSY